MRWSDDPFEIARERGEALGACPIYLLDEFHAEHWDTDTLCSGFRCESCVGSPYDDWLEEQRREEVDAPGTEHEGKPRGQHEIPF